MYLLDTNVLSDIVRRPRGKIGKRILQVGTNSVATNVIVAGELRFGALKNVRPGLAARIEEVLGLVSILPLNENASRAYGEIRVELERLGTPISANDLWIAAHARAEGLTLVTANEREFARVTGLRIENWLA